MSMRTAVFCFSDNGCMLAEKLCKLLGIPTGNIHTTQKFAEKYGSAFTSHKSVCANMGGLFSSHDALIFICACGIAVRDIAPHIKSKTADPAVLVIDDRGQFVIPLLSGHIGGANALAKEIAALLGAVAVITTATDIGGRFSCDEWAARHTCAISSLKAAKEISARILTQDICISSEYLLPETLPAGLFRAESGEAGIYIGIKTVSPYDITLRLVPRMVTVGVGCRRNTGAKAIAAAVRETFAAHGIDPASIGGIASIDVKKDEAGLLEYAEKLGVIPAFYSAEELKAVPGQFEESEFVLGTVGVGNVCERAASCGGKALIIKKTACGGITVAAAVREWSVDF